MTSAEVTKVNTSGKGVKATIKTKDGEQEISADIVLSAVGIKTNIENIVTAAWHPFIVRCLVTLGQVLASSVRCRKNKSPF